MPKSSVNPLRKEAKQKTQANFLYCPSKQTPCATTHVWQRSYSFRKQSAKASCGIDRRTAVTRSLLAFTSAKRAHLMAGCLQAGKNYRKKSAGAKSEEYKGVIKHNYHLLSQELMHTDRTVCRGIIVEQNLKFARCSIALWHYLSHWLRSTGRSRFTLPVTCSLCCVSILPMSLKKHAHAHTRAPSCFSDNMISFIKFFRHTLHISISILLYVDVWYLTCFNLLISFSEVSEFSCFARWPHCR